MQPAVLDAQRRLNTLGFDAGPEDGLMGRRTRGAIRAFQASIGAAQTGQLTNEQTAMLVQRTTAPPPGTFINAGHAPTSAQQAYGQPNFGQQPGLAPPAAAPPAAHDINPGNNLPPIAGAAPGVGQGVAQPAGLPQNEGLQFEPVQPMPEPYQQALGSAVDTPVATETSTAAAGAAATSSIETAAVIPAAGQPQSEVLGVRPLETARDAEAKLSAAGFANCERIGAGLRCEVRADTMHDTVLVGLSAEAEPRVHTVTRTIQFATPQPRGALTAQIAAKYQDLMQAPGGIMVSSPECRQAAAEGMGGANGRLAGWIASGPLPPAELARIASVCEYYQQLALPAGEQIDTMSITLFAGEPVRASTPPATEAVQVRF